MIAQTYLISALYLAQDRCFLRQATLLAGSYADSLDQRAALDRIQDSTHSFLCNAGNVASRAAQEVTGSPQVDSREIQPENVTLPRTPLEEKLFARIPGDLEPWRNGITREMVEHTYCTVSLPQLKFSLCKPCLQSRSTGEDFLH